MQVHPDHRIVMTRCGTIDRTRVIWRILYHPLACVSSRSWVDTTRHRRRRRIVTTITTILRQLRSYDP